MNDQTQTESKTKTDSEILHYIDWIMCAPRDESNPKNTTENRARILKRVLELMTPEQRNNHRIMKAWHEAKDDVQVDVILDIIRSQDN
jgi:hypothetical protein